MCSTAQNDSERGRCYQRNIVYETFCIIAKKENRKKKWIVDMYSLQISKMKKTMTKLIA